MSRSVTPRGVTSDADQPLQTRLALAGVWMVCTLINVGKAAHIDDAAHFEIARWIADHPLHPRGSCSGVSMQSRSTT